MGGAWWVGGHFALTTPNHPNLVFAERFGGDGLPLPIKWQPIYYYEKIRLMLTMKKVGQTPSLFSAPILMGSFFGLLSLVWRPKFLHGYPLVFGFLFLGIFAPYYFVNNWGYPPRFSIHLLPIAVMSSILVIRNIELTLRNSKFD